MRKILTIPFIILILFSGITVNLAFHYCGGMLADKSISLSGKPASCGMEGEESPHPTGMKRLCCEDAVSSFTFNNIYIQSSKDESADQKIPAHDNFVISVPEATATLITTEVLARPPGFFPGSEVSLDMICVFRI